jgi:DNA polymerase III epsilon subunit-like protein
MVNLRWYARMASFLGGFPDNYLVFDCETNGIKERSRQTLPVDLGWCMIKSRVPVHEDSFLINWALHPDIDPVWFEQSVRETARRMAEQGKAHVGWEKLRDEGLDPREIMPLFREFLEDALTNDYWYAGHNGYGFDRPIIENATYTATGDMFRFDYRRFMDSGMIFKAKATGFPIPEPGAQHVFRWYEDVRGLVRKGKWSLSTCLHELGLIERYEIDMEGMHGAAQDCRCTHYVLEAFRELAEAGQLSKADVNH